MGRSRKSGGRVSARKWREEVRGGSNYLRRPEGLKVFEGKAGKYRLDFMSFIAGEGNPRVEAGEPYFERTFFVHQGIGPNKDWHLCSARTFKKPCPVCEHRAKLSADPEADEALIKSLAPKERQLWLVKDLTNDPDSVLVWEVSYHLFGKQLKDKINNSDEEDGYDYFADPTEGLTMRLALQQSDKGKWVEAADIEFRARTEQYESEIIKEMPCLDEMLVATPYDKYKSLFLQMDDSDDDEPRKEKKTRERKPRDEDDEPEERSKKKSRREVSVGDEVGFNGLKCEVIHVSGDGTSLILEDSNGDIHKAVGFDDLEDPPKKKSKPRQEVDDEDEDPPKKKSKPRQEVDDEDEEERKPTKTSKSVDDEWDDGWDENDEPPKKKSKSKPKVEKEEDEEDEKPSKSNKKKQDDEEWDEW